ncbi:hypothetical protein [Sphingobacterium corticibacterium]|uniref:Uncharacterized protein n=1 Tax=Sphingobacterium corticibacterium TaxID=2484746 RepID=A0A4Q6XNG1_9SPHI|nr:hypothetical protein [Sphingobacterium corticibacterium]RZF58017.1 hypothetical protein EWE74_20355 [Sphingobacterium corticibacterium]
MKRFLLAFLIGTAALASTSSCTKEYYENYDLIPSITAVYTVTGNSWIADGSSNAYTDLDVPELTDYYIKQGIVNIALSFDNEDTYHTNGAIHNGVTYRFDYSEGLIRIYAAGTNVLNRIPQSVVVKVSLTEADYVE